VTLEWVAEVQFVRRMVRLFALPPGTTYRYFDGESSLEEWGGEPARVDPLALLWAGLRDHGSRSTRLEPTLARLGNAPLRLHEALDPERFGFRSAELAAVGCMREAAPTLPALLGAGIAPEQELRHLVYTLLITRYVDLGGSNALPVGIARSGRAPMPSASMLGRLQLRRELNAQGGAPRLKDRELGRADIVGEAGADLHGDERARVATLARKLTGEGEERGRLAGLAGSVEDEVALLVDEAPDIRQPTKRRKDVVQLRLARSGGVEPARHGGSFQTDLNPIPTFYETAGKPNHFQNLGALCPTTLHDPAPDTKPRGEER